MSLEKCTQISSPVKSIILPFLLNREHRIFNEDWKEDGYQLVHVEPMSNNSICGVVMRATKQSDGTFTLELDIRLDSQNAWCKIDQNNTRLELNDGPCYDYDLFLGITKKDNPDEPSNLILEGSYNLKKDDLIDLTFTPAFIDFETNGQALIDLDAAASVKRICKICVF